MIAAVNQYAAVNWVCSDIDLQNDINVFKMRKSPCQPDNLIKLSGFFRYQDKNIAALILLKASTRPHKFSYVLDSSFQAICFQCAIF